MSNDNIIFHHLPYVSDSAVLFEAFRDLPHACLLDSSFESNQKGRWDIIVADPNPCTPQYKKYQSPSRWLDDLQQFYRERYRSADDRSEGLPFCGGLLGYLDYEFGMQLVELDNSSSLGGRASVHAYDWALLQDHKTQRCVLSVLPSLSRAKQRDIIARVRSAATSAKPKGSTFSLDTAFQSNMLKADYRDSFERIQEYIHAGDCYQINFAQRFSARYSGDPWQAFLQLRHAAQAPFSAYLQDGSRTLMSLSPERFISVKGSRVSTSPIKGTRPRHSNPARDAHLARELQASEKDRAENLMIVDLLRNDLGRSCVAGSISVDELFAIESFATVHHLVSTISGTLRPDCDAIDVLRCSFPGGSITGAPKRRAMEIIHTLEPSAREVFCGSLFYLNINGHMDSNILIRTALCDRGEIRSWAGGGIVADSTWEAEFQESLDKITPLLTSLG